MKNIKNLFEAQFATWELVETFLAISVTLGENKYIIDLEHDLYYRLDINKNVSLIHLHLF